jgi:hypothetical protein
MLGSHQCHDQVIDQACMIATCWEVAAATVHDALLPCARHEACRAATTVLATHMQIRTCVFLTCSTVVLHTKHPRTLQQPVHRSILMCSILLRCPWQVPLPSAIHVRAGIATTFSKPEHGVPIAAVLRTLAASSAALAASSAPLTPTSAPHTTTTAPPTAAANFLTPGVCETRRTAHSMARWCTRLMQ